jgi:rhomboid protease GluP
MLIALLVLAAFALYVTTAAERTAGARKLVDAFNSILDVFAFWRLRPNDPFYVALRARSAWPLVTYSIIVINLAVVLAMLVEANALGNPGTLVDWGASVGPRTTNGERWRLFTSLFVHEDVVHVLVNVVALVQLGFILERAVGRLIFTTVYLTAGVLGAVATVAAAPLAVTAGATCAIVGIYGLLFAALLRATLGRSEITIPLRALKTLVPGAVAFVVYNMAIGSTDLIVKVGLCTGFTGGIVLTRQVADGVVRMRRAAALTTATAAIVFLAVMAVRVVADIRPDIAAVVALEERTAQMYDAAVSRFQHGGMTSRALAQLIDQVIVPDLQRARVHVRTLSHVPPADAPLLAQTEEYLRLRNESWRLRADALRRTDMRELKKADRTAHESLQVLERVKFAVSR